MEIGMLWFDDGPKPLQEKVAQAVAFYEDKFGNKPTHCLVHPTTLNGGEGLVGSVLVRKARNVMPNHYWIGVEDQPGKTQVTSPNKKSKAAATEMIHSRAA
jgi:hypothetical protein